jgi:hypothetical protein
MPNGTIEFYITRVSKRVKNMCPHKFFYRQQMIIPFEIGIYLTMLT